MLCTFTGLILTCAVGLAQAQANAYNVTVKELKRWSHSGKLPKKARGSKPCDFYKFAWQEFLALISKDKTDNFTFENFGSSAALFPEPPGVPGEFPSSTSGMVTTQVGKTPQVGQAASLVPVVDHAFGKDQDGYLTGRWIHYSILTNKTEWDFIKDQGYFDVVTFNNALAAQKTASSAPQIDILIASIELKLSWKIMETCHLPDSPKTGCMVEDKNSFITVKGDVPQYGPGENYTKTISNMTLGLVGLHIIHKTDRHRDSVWATFEHRRNAPDCDKLDEPGPWTFYDRKGPQTHINNFCTLCPVPLSQFSVAGRLTALEQAVPLSAKFTGNKLATTINGSQGPALQCTSNPGSFKSERVPLFHGTADQPYCLEEAKTRALSTQVCREKTNQIKPEVTELNDLIARKLPKGSKLAANYQLVGVQWFEPPCVNPKTKKSEECGPVNVLPDPHAALSNVTIETFEQGVTCVVCHSESVNNPHAGAILRKCLRGRARRPLIHLPAHQTRVDPLQMVNA